MARYGEYEWPPDIFAFWPDANDTDVRVNIDYGNPYPSDWAWVETSFYFYVELPGSEYSGMPARVAVRHTLAEAAAGPLQPVVSPITDARIEGRDLFQRQGSVGETPILSWGAPELGSPSSYVVEVFKITVIQGDPTTITYADRLTSIWTDREGVRVPPGVLLPGDEYFFRITAQTRDGDAAMVTNFVTP